MFDKNTNWLLTKWWYITALFISVALIVAGLFSIFPYLMLGVLGIVTCILAFQRLDKYQKFYGIRLNQFRFRQWWWWLIAFFSLSTFSSATAAFLIGLFFLLLAVILLFMPPGGNKIRFK